MTISNEYANATSSGGTYVARDFVQEAAHDLYAALKAVMKQRRLEFHSDSASYYAFKAIAKAEGEDVSTWADTEWPFPSEGE